MNDVERWAETPGGRLRRVLGVVDADVSVRARELLDAAEMEHRAQYGTEPAPRRWPWEAGLVAAAAEQFQMPAVTSYELAARWNEQDPLARIGVMPEPPSTGFAMRLTQNGQVQYAGDPAAIQRMKDSFAAGAARRVELDQRERAVLGPLFGTVA